MTELSWVGRPGKFLSWNEDISLAELRNSLFRQMESRNIALFSSSASISI